MTTPFSVPCEKYFLAKSGDIEFHMKYMDYPKQGRTC